LIVLDTNVVVRIMKGEGLIGVEARQILDGIENRYCSTIMQWELAMLASKRKLAFDMPLAIWIERASAMLRFVDAPVTAAIARDAGSLPGAIHGDPCDRIMIATARSLECPIITTDRKILNYAEAGYVQAIDAEQ
jgi:PIN domain nuclease of toxin-antitoxin system